MRLYVPPVPLNSNFSVEDMPGAVKISWTVKPHTLGRIFAIVCISAFLVFMTSIWLNVFQQFALNPSTIFFLVFTALSMVWITGISIVVALPLRPESITMDIDSLTHYIGTAATAQKFVASQFIGRKTMRNNQEMIHRFVTLGELFRSRKPKTYLRKHIDKIALHGTGQSQRLAIDIGADRIEIGAGLREPEREWLHDILLHWWESKEYSGLVINYDEQSKR
ncbi:MAG: hypothetical protein R3B84_19290 [Zavarzinella sp.]